MGPENSSARMDIWFQFAVSLLWKHILMLTAVVVSLFGMYLKFLDRLQSWVPHTRTRKNVLVQPPHSPDLNASDSYLLGHLKPLGYSGPIEMKVTLHLRILMHVKPFPNTPGTFGRMRLSMNRRVHVCIDSKTKWKSKLRVRLNNRVK
jgi:hypothetical protein